MLLSRSETPSSDVREDLPPLATGWLPLSASFLHLGIHAFITGVFGGARSAVGFALVPFPPPHLNWASGFLILLHQTGPQRLPGSY